MSLAILTHTASAAPPFNGTFYTTAALVIPVLFLAVAVQGSFYQDLVNAITSAARHELHAPTPAQRQRASERKNLLITIAIVIVLYSVVSEIAAITALYQQHDNPFGFFIFAATIIMIIAAAAPPAVVLGRGLASAAPPQQPDARPGHATGAGEPEPAPGTPSETGKTDAEG